MTSALEGKGIVKDFPVDDECCARVLHGVDIGVRLGEMTMLVGPSGCGKTTLISILSGILSFTEGHVTALGQDLGAMTDRERVVFRRRHIGFIFQQFNLLSALTAAENAAIPLVAAGMPLDQAASRARAILSRIGMERETEKLPRQLSGGQQQRVAIARALVHDPEIVVCDEPTASLDAKTGHDVMDILRDLSKNPRRAALVVTHDQRIYSYADRIIEMADGLVVGETPDQAQPAKG